jgi:hypothetical protein
MIALYRASAELVNVESCCDEAQQALEELEKFKGLTQKAKRKIEEIVGILQTLQQHTTECEYYLMDAEIVMDKPREYELYPYPESLAEVMAAESALQSLGLNLWGVE